MDIKALTKKRLRQQLADEKAAFDAQQAAKLAEADALAAKAERDAIAVAASEATDNQLRVDAQWASKLESASASGIGADIGTVAERACAMERTGISPAAIMRAAACGGNLYDDDLITYNKDGSRQLPQEALAAVVSAMMGIYRRTLNDDERKAHAEVDRKRKEALAELADSRMAEYAAIQETAARMER